MTDYKFLIYSGETHSADAIARTTAEAVTRDCDADSTEYWWTVLEKTDGLESALMIEDTEEDKENLTAEELSELVDISESDSDWFYQSV